MENRFTFSLDIKQSIINNIRFQQGDLNGSVLEAHLLDNSVAKDITGATVEFRFLKSDNTIVYQNSGISIDKTTILDASNGVVECILNPAALSTTGIIKCEIKLTSADGLEEVTIPYFRLTVNSSIGIDGILSSSYISAIETIKDAYESALHDNVNVELVKARHDEITGIDYTDVAERMDAQSASLADKAKQVDLDTQAARIDNLTISASNYYTTCLSTDTGALQVVSSGATTGQINLASVTPKLDNYTPVAGDYVRLVSNGLTAETTDIRIGADGITDTSAGVAVRRQFADIKNNLTGYVYTRTENLLLPSMLSDTYYISYTTGNISSNANYCATVDYMPIDANTYYNLYSTSGTINPQVAWYDSNKNYIAGASSRTFKTSANAVYIRVSCEKQYKNSVILSKGQFSQEEIYIPYYTLVLNSNPNVAVYTLADFDLLTTGSYGETITGNYSKKYTTTFTTRSTALYTKNVANLKTGDFIFGRCKINANNNVDQVNIQVVGSDGVYYNNIFRGLKANKDYRLFFRSANFTSSTATNMYLKINILKDDGSVTTTADVSEICLSINNYNCWYDDDTKATLPDFNTTRYTVGLDGVNHFPDVYSACQFAAYANDVINKPVTIFVKNGIYDLYIGNNEPYAIYKGSNRISIIGESRDGVILQKTCTNLKQGRIIDAGGACSIENMTLIQNIDASFVSEYTNSRAYCIHLDSDFISSTEYKTVLKNLTCINYVNAPVGAGLRNNQKLVYDNCNLIYKAATGLNGAFYTHAPNDSSAANCSLVVDSCNIQHLASSGRAILIDDVAGSLSYTNIPCTFVRNAIYSQSSITVTDNFKTTHNIQPISCLNNVIAMNY